MVGIPAVKGKIRGNAWHEPTVGKGEFANKLDLANRGEGSWSYKKNPKKMVAGGLTKTGQPKLKKPKKEPCGRAARKSKDPKKKYMRCWDGESGYPWDSSKKDDDEKP